MSLPLKQLRNSLWKTGWNHPSLCTGTLGRHGGHDGELFSTHVTKTHGPCLHQPQKVRVAVVLCMGPTPKGFSAPGTAGSVPLAPTCPHITLPLRTRQETALTTLVTNFLETVETGGPVHLSPARVIHFRTLGIDDCAPKSSPTWCSGTAVPCALGIPIECYLRSVTKTLHTRLQVILTSPLSP